MSCSSRVNKNTNVDPLFSERTSLRLTQEKMAGAMIGTSRAQQMNDATLHTFLLRRNNQSIPVVYNDIIKRRSSPGGCFSESNLFKITDLDNSPWGAGSSFGLKPVKSAGVLGTVHTSPSIQVFADNPKPGSYIVVNYANPKDLNKFIQLQNDVWKPFIKNFINDPESSLAGWEVHRVVSPTGNAYNWNVATIDHYTSLSGAMNPFPNGFDWPEGLEEINNLLPNGKFTRSVIYEVVFYEGPDASK